MNRCFMVRMPEADFPVRCVLNAGRHRDQRYRFGAPGKRRGSVYLSLIVADDDQFYLSSWPCCSLSRVRFSAVTSTSDNNSAFGVRKYDTDLDQLRTVVKVAPESYRSALVDGYLQVADRYYQAGQIERYIEPWHLLPARSRRLHPCT